MCFFYAWVSDTPADTQEAQQVTLIKIEAYRWRDAALSFWRPNLVYAGFGLIVY